MLITPCAVHYSCVIHTAAFLDKKSLWIARRCFQLSNTSIYIGIYDSRSNMKPLAWMEHGDESHWYLTLPLQQFPYSIYRPQKMYLFVCCNSMIRRQSHFHPSLFIKGQIINMLIDFFNDRLFWHLLLGIRNTIGPPLLHNNIHQNNALYTNCIPLNLLWRV